MRLALPTLGDGSDVFNNSNYYPSGTIIGGNPASNGNPAINPTYDDLLAVWDAYNGTSTGTEIFGLPPGWGGGLHYWSATPSTSGYARIYLNWGYVSNASNVTESDYVALEVVADDVTINDASNAGGASAPSTVNVSAAGTGDASIGNVKFAFAPGTYAYSISGFNAGDVIDFPAGQNPTVNNTSFQDGSVDLQWAISGDMITVTITGLTATQDASLFSVYDFNTLFGAGTII